VNPPTLPDETQVKPGRINRVEGGKIQRMDTCFHQNDAFFMCEIEWILDAIHRIVRDPLFCWNHLLYSA
jgi:hypothetical protein